MTCDGQGSLFAVGRGDVPLVPAPETAHARRTDPSTSQRSAAVTEAVEGSTPTLRPGTLRHLALATIAKRPMTPKETGREADQAELWKRVSDLKLAGLIEAIDERVDPVTNRPAEVLRITPLGREVLAQLDRGEAVSVVMHEPPKKRDPARPVVPHDLHVAVTDLIAACHSERSVCLLCCAYTGEGNPHLNGCPVAEAEQKLAAADGSVPPGKVGAT